MQLLSCCVPATSVTFAVGVGLGVVLLRVVLFELVCVAPCDCVLWLGLPCALCRDIVIVVDCWGFCGFVIVSPICFAVVMGCLLGCCRNLTLLRGGFGLYSLAVPIFEPLIGHST